MIGQSIGQYKIIEKLGEGGMGVVYKAHDTKLDRTVALKFLPHHLTVHDEERARFLQEARAASALNHPNVCVIHDLQEYNGEHFIVMEFVDGMTLREKIDATARSKEHLLPLDTVVAYALQIGEALQEAHAKGIVHRDVKAENIMVTTKNQIKVMDFGLAKLKGSLKLTRTSSTVGTLAYMAPEQLQGGEVDARSDIFSFGVVLYEMLSGETPFRGEHEAAMMYSILNEDPAPVEQHRPGLSSEYLHILHRSLEKNPDERYQSVAEMVIDLRRLKRQSTRVTRSVPVMHPGAPEQEHGAAPPQIAPTVKRRWIPIAAGAVVLIAIAAWLVVRSLGPGSLAGRLNPNMTFRVLQAPFAQIGYPGLSQDGNWLAFPAAGSDQKWDVYFMNSLSGEARRITADSSAQVSQTDISPDGGRIAYDRIDVRSGVVECAVVSSLGGVSKVIARNGMLPRWTSSGARLGFVRGVASFIPSASGKLELWSVKSDGTDQRREFIDSLSILERFSYSWSPDEKSVAWVRSFPAGYQELIVCDLAGGTTRQLTFDRKNIDEVCWTRQGEIIFSSNKSGNMNLWVIPAEGGQAVQLTRGSGPDFGMKISADGTKLLYYQQQQISNIWIAAIDGSNAHPVTFQERRLSTPDLSPDGRTIAFELWGTDPVKLERTICAIQQDGTGQREITSGDGIAESPKWSPDGKWIAFLTHGVNEPHDSARVAIVDAANPGAPRPLMKGVGSLWVDSQTIAIFATAAGRTRTLLVPIDGSPTRTFGEDSTILLPVLKTKYALSIPELRTSIARIVPVNDGVFDWGHARMLNSGTVMGAAFGPNDSYVLVHNGQDQMIRIDLPSGRREVLAHKFPAFDMSSAFAVSKDGKQIVYDDSKRKGNLVMIENMR